MSHVNVTSIDHPIDDVATATTNPASAPVRGPKVPKSKNKDLPPYFVDKTLSKAEKRKCLLKLDREIPERVTHLTSVLYSEVDPSNADHYVSLDAVILDYLRKIPCVFEMRQPTTLKNARSMINDIVAVPKNTAAIAANAERMDEVVETTSRTTVKIFMRLIGVLFSNQYAPLKYDRALPSQSLRRGVLIASR